MTEPVGLFPNRPVRLVYDWFDCKPPSRFDEMAGSNWLANEPVKPGGFGSNGPVLKTMVPAFTSYIDQDGL